MTRDEAIEYLKGIPEGEPVFVLRAQDKVAPHVVLMWVATARFAGASWDKTNGALVQEQSMFQWQENNPDKVKVPD